MLSANLKTSRWHDSTSQAIIAKHGDQSSIVLCH